MSFRLFRFVLLGSLLLAPMTRAQLQPQADNNAIRVTVSINPDGSRTTYESDPANHKASSTTTTADGQPKSKTLYVLDDAGRYSTGQVFGPRGELRFKSRYKYDEAGRLSEETQLSKDDVVQHKLVYSYNPEGKQIGYAIYDGHGKLLGRTTKPTTR